jgi:hypothetical protein
MASNKYHAKTCFYNGFWYDSKFEANYAMNLDMRLKAKDIDSWERQYPARIMYNGEKICSLWEETDVYKLKKRLLEIMWLPDHPDHTYLVVK